MFIFSVIKSNYVTLGKKKKLWVLKKKGIFQQVIQLYSITPRNKTRNSPSSHKHPGSLSFQFKGKRWS